MLSLDLSLGSRAAQILAAGIPKGWGILLIDRNSHAHHVYVLPRFSVLPGHEHKAFIPYHSVFQPPTDDHLVLDATVLSLTTKSVTLSRSFPEHGIATAAASSIRRGGASREIEVILNERLDMSSADKYNEAGQRVVRPLSRRDIATDLMDISSFTSPNTALLKGMDPNTVDVQTGIARVLKTLQLSDLERDPDTLPATLAKVSLEGNAADAFGAIKAGHNAYFQVRSGFIFPAIDRRSWIQGEVAARNVLRLINDSDEPLELYTPGPPVIKVSLGLTKGMYQVDGVIGVNNDGVEDLQAPAVWAYYGIKVEGEDEMYD
ncbi:hypothetical protein IW262DRAFT_1465042 [Armillaria fumosa]|nr:hypothetical protein IW262DRAFT_1465042 [Armillaria fumosa]